MSTLGSLYQNTKHEKVSSDKNLVSFRMLNEKMELFVKKVEQLGTQITSFEKIVDNHSNDLSDIRLSLKELKSLNMSEFTDKHARMKESYNKLVSSYNETTSELNVIVCDISKRLNTCENLLSVSL